MDRNAVQLIHPVKSFVGTSFFGSHTQDVTGHNERLNNLVKKVLSGKQDFNIYEFRNDERLNTGYPISVKGKPTYFIFVITPTSSIYSQINDVILTQRTETFSLLAGVTAAVLTLLIFLVKWNNSLNNEVKIRTKELNESNKQLAEANEQLKAHDKMQKEFINMAAHELRTPIQPLLVVAKSLQRSFLNEERISIVARGTERLQKLASNMLNVARIESKILKLEFKEFNLNEVVSNIAQEYKTQVERTTDINNGSDLKILYQNDNNDTILVKADRERITQVVHNLLNNALKFTKEGSIIISVGRENKEAIVSIRFWHRS